jgi:hypothetical protein
MGSWLAQVTIASSFVALLTPSHTQPLPCTPTPPAFMAALNAAKLPHFAVIMAASFPVGSPPPPLPAGARFCQKMEWFTCPPPLKRSAGCSAIISETLPDADALAYFSSATFKLVTYALWCLVWWMRMISPEIAGSSAP